MKHSKKWLFFPALGLGIVILFIAIKMRPELPVEPNRHQARLVDVIELEAIPMAPRVVGFGKAKPKVEWKAIAEVSGKVVYRHPKLAKGEILTEGTEILRIDPLDYQLKVTQAQADLASAQASLASLSIEESHIKNTLKIERDRLAISQKELKRKQNLRQRKLAAQSDVDVQQQAYLAQKKLVSGIENQLALLPNERKVARAKVAMNEVRLNEAKRSLAKTRIVLPHDLRISQVDIEQEQVVTQQQMMVLGHGITTMEVEAQLSISDMHTLIQSLGAFAHDEQGMPMANDGFTHAYIELQTGSVTARWPAQVTRVSETVDPAQSTAGVILEVKQDYRNLSPQSTPPLVNGMFVQAVIEGKPQASWVVPERALHGSRIYVMNEDDTLSIMPVSVRYRRDNHVVIEGALAAGMRVVLNDLLPVIEGMPLRLGSDIDKEGTQ